MTPNVCKYIKLFYGLAVFKLTISDRSLSPSSRPEIIAQEAE